MANLSSIVVLLQLVLTLLSNPSTANSAQAQTLATQAISMATQALQSNTSPSVNSSSSTSQSTSQPNTIVSTPSNCPSEIINASQLSLVPAGCPTPTILDQQTQFANESYLSFDSEAINNSTQNLYSLQTRYAQLRATVGAGTGMSEYTGEQNLLSALYNPLLQAAQITLQNAEAQQKIDQARSVGASIESQIEYEQSQNEECSSSSNLSEAGGVQGLQAQEKANECVASAEKEANDIQSE